jgi:glycine/D-amino acid oxidase-like deaminating enzyme
MNSMKQKKIDFLIVGAGIAGTTLALELHQRGKSIAVIDEPNPNSSSRVAAGILNPVVPKGITTTWKIDALFPAVFNYYQRWEVLLDGRFIESRNFITLHKTTDEYNQWQKRYNHPNMQPWIEPTMVPHWLPENLNHGASNTLKAGRLNVKLFLELAKDYLINQGIRWFSEPINVNSTVNKSHFDNLRLNEIEYDSIVFCQGVNGSENPLFPNLFYDPTAGDILTVSIPGLPNDCMLKRGLWLVPTENNTWLIGSNFIKGNNAHSPQIEDAEQLLSQIRSWIPFPIELIAHKRGIRPTVQNRRPYLGQSPLPGMSNCYIFNGLGSKGGSLCSWLAPMLADHLCFKKPLDPEVDIRRFYSEVR